MEAIVILLICTAIAAICIKYGFKPLFIGLGLLLAVLLVKVIVFSMVLICAMQGV